MPTSDKAHLSVVVTLHWVNKVICGAELDLLDSATRLALGGSRGLGGAGAISIVQRGPNFAPPIAMS